MRRDYKFIVVLSRGVTVKPNGPNRFSSGASDFNYEIEGDPYSFCFKAIKDLFDSGACKNFILVGGVVKTANPDGSLTDFIDRQGTTVPKAEVMKDCLVNRYGIPSEHLITLVSASNTEGNAKAVQKYFQENSIIDTDDVGILSIYNHLVRAMRIFIDVADLRLIPIPAEGLIYNEEYSNIRKFYETDGFSKIIGLNINDPSEIKGMGDREKGEYTSLNK